MMLCTVFISDKSLILFITVFHCLTITFNKVPTAFSAIQMHSCFQSKQQGISVFWLKKMAKCLPSLSVGKTRQQNKCSSQATYAMTVTFLNLSWFVVIFAVCFSSVKTYDLAFVIYICFQFLLSNKCVCGKVQ